MKTFVAIFAVGAGCGLVGAWIAFYPGCGLAVVATGYLIGTCVGNLLSNLVVMVAEHRATD